ncbi:Glycosyltransferase family 2 protein [Balamuthia mandrillaris]
MPPPPQALAAKMPTSFSVIVPAYNTGPYVARTLKSVETSIDFFFRLTGTLWKEVKAEVVVVDDASSDNTLSMVLGFVHRRKPQQRAPNIAWKVLSLTQQVFAGAEVNQQRIMEYAEQQRKIGAHQPKEWALEIFFATPTDTSAALKQQFNDAPSFLLFFFLRKGSRKFLLLVFTLVLLALLNQAVSLEHKLPPQAMADGYPTSFSIVVPAFNTSLYVINTLKSVETIKAEVVVVDDASPDNTLSKVLSFVDRRRKAPSPNVTWKVLSLPQQVFAGSARNLGVYHSKGEVLFFLDADDLYHPEHVYVCFVGLAARWRIYPMAETNVNIELEGIPLRRQRKIIGTIPQNKCMFRKYHEFVEGFPEQIVFREYEDAGWVKAMAALGGSTWRVTPWGSIGKGHDFTNSVDGYLRIGLLRAQVRHLKTKEEAALQGRMIEANPFWAIHSHRFKQASKNNKCRDISITDWNCMQLLVFAEQERKSGWEQPLQWALQVVNNVCTTNSNSSQQSSFSLCCDLFLYP